MIDLDEVIGMTNEDGEQMALQSVSAKAPYRGYC